MKKLIVSFMTISFLFSSSMTKASDGSEILRSIQSALKAKDLLCYDIQTGIKYYASSLNPTLESKDLEVSLSDDQSLIRVKSESSKQITTIDFKVNSDITNVERVTLINISPEDGSIIRTISCF